ncbi:DUF922 domain-containing protein [Segetibacter aerophilus]|uniref:DUF922 domain-containing protein n=1 Tax=Segetibacter aerophilus TaxID=670293 RepID=A0A512B7X0_9BACT|nr:hypothetical protein [Segetibacter aerophilus]GEO08072.1 hypothetical protein SAE01_05680 [Segetibacter aerophilus]
MKAFFIVACISTFVTHSFAQDSRIIWNDKQPLQWFDFAGPVNDTSVFDAESFAEVKFTYTFKSPTDFYFDVFANFHKNLSWYKKEYQSEALLKHEQLHFDIAGLYSKRLKAAFDNYQYSNNYKNEIQQIFNEKKIEYHLMQKQYDEETNHSLNKERQKDWEKYIHEQLNETGLQFNVVKK